jgi:hypothetical protein
VLSPADGQCPDPELCDVSRAFGLPASDCGAGARVDDVCIDPACADANSGTAIATAASTGHATEAGRKNTVLAPCEVRTDTAVDAAAAAAPKLCAIDAAVDPFGNAKVEVNSWHGAQHHHHHHGGGEVQSQQAQQQQRATTIPDCPVEASRLAFFNSISEELLETIQPTAEQLQQLRQLQRSCAARQKARTVPPL